MELGKEPPVGPVAASVAKAANISALLQALAIGALPEETVEGLLVAAETAIIVQRAIGVMDEDGANALRLKIAEWGRTVVERMEEDGTAEQIREQHRGAVEEYRKAQEAVEKFNKVGGDEGGGLN